MQSFICLMSRNTKQFRHPIRFLSTLFLPAVCHQELELTDIDSVAFWLPFRSHCSSCFPGKDQKSTQLLRSCSNVQRHLLQAMDLKRGRGQDLHKEHSWNILVAQFLGCNCNNSSTNSSSDLCCSISHFPSHLYAV